MLDWVQRIKPTAGSPLELQGQENRFGFQRHTPEIMENSHWHGHIEINFLFGCSADYLINGQKIHVPAERMIVFWASIPHQMVDYQGDGEMINIYIPLQVFLSWKLPAEFNNLLLHGEVLVSDSTYASDEPVTRMWEKDLAMQKPDLTSQVINEIRNRVHRMAIEEYSDFDLGKAYEEGDSLPMVNGINHIQTMLGYIAKNYDQKITIESVANSTGLHKNYAMKLFARVMKVSIKQYINQLRLHHAQALLVDTDNAVLNVALDAGFGSVSRFYDIFQREMNMSPMEFRRSVVENLMEG